MMSSDLSLGLVRRKHTRFGELRIKEAVSKAVQQLPQFVTNEAVRIQRFQETQISMPQAESFVLQA